MSAELTPKNSNIKKCELCDFECRKQNEWIRHLNTRKHKNRTELNDAEQKNSLFVCKLCNKEYKARNSLWYHEQKCKNIIVGNNQINNIELKIIDDNNNENVIVQDSSNNDIIQVLLKENSDFKNMLMDMMKNTTDLVKNNTDLQKQNQDIQKQMLELCKNNNSNTTNINNTDNSNNSKTFNLQVFLNEKCKDAMNLDDFANSIQLKLSDLIRVGEEGYIPGMSKVFIERLKDVEVCDRPIHCSDEKREVIQVKVADKWEKEAMNSEKLMNAVRIIEQKQFDMITTFRDTYPECMNSESHHNDMLIKLFQNLSNSREPEFIKVMKKVAKSVVIDKENN